jgi:hypothetical protein
VRAYLAAFAVVALTAGCGSASHPSSKPSAAPPGSLQALWKQSGESVALIPGTTDYSPGQLRISFLVVDRGGKVVSPPKARVWIADALLSKPFAQSVATAENVGVPGVTANAPVRSLYVAHVRVRTPGTYYVLARPIGSRRIGGIGQVQVKAHSQTPEIGARAYPSKTPTLASTHGRIAPLTTAVPPDRPLLEYSVADSLAAHVPFVVTFATPRWCESRTCGPVVDVVAHERKRFAHTRIRFIHVEVYRDNDPRKGYNKWFKQWRLPSEPWTFLVGSDGRIKQKFAGSMSARELDAAIRQYLL